MNYRWRAAGSTSIWICSIVKKVCCGTALTKSTSRVSTVFATPVTKNKPLDFKLPFPTTQAIYDNLTFTVDGNPVAITNQKNAATTVVQSRAPVKLLNSAVSYSSQGLNEWRYSFGTSAKLRRCAISICA